MDVGFAVRPRHVVWLSACALAFLCACAGHAGRTLEARSQLDAHNAKRALELYNEELEVKSGKELPNTDEDEDAALLLLDRSTIQQQLEAYADASRDLEAADKKVEMLDFSRSTADEIGRYLFSDDTGVYKARPFEKLLINTLNMVSYLARGDLGGAKIEARRLAVMQKYLAESEDDPTAGLLGPGSYLAGFVFERAGDANEALRYYDEALKATNYDSLHEPICRLSQRASYRSPRISQLLSSVPAQNNPDDVDVLVIVQHGRVPALRAERMPIGLAMTYGALYMGPTQQVAARRMAGQGLVTWVNFPQLEDDKHSYQAASVAVDGRAVSIDTVTNVDAFVRADYEKNKGRVIASAITRLVTRGALGAGAGVAAGKASDSGAVGMLVALSSQAALTAADTPDTRSWATLPARISFARVRLPPGKHKVSIAASGMNHVKDVEVPKAGWVVVNFTDLSQY